MRIRWRRNAKVGIALGGGGVRGLAHIPLLGVLEEMGITPACVTGTSMGAVIGVLFCAGLKSAEIRRSLVSASTVAPRLVRRFLEGNDLLKWFEFMLPGLDGRSLFRADKFLDHVFELVGAARFEALKVPLRVVAADFWQREEVVLERGDLVTAVRASMAVPGIFPPVLREGRLLVDGGLVNPVPWDLLPADCDITIAVEVTGRRVTSREDRPSALDLLFNTFEIAEQSLNRFKRRMAPPDIYIEPALTNIEILDVGKIEQVFRQAAPACDELRRALKARLG